MAAEAHPAAPFAPFHLLWFAQLKWDKAHSGLDEFTGELQRSYIQGFSDRCAVALRDCDCLRRLVDHLITYIYKGKGGMKIIFEASRRVTTFPCLCSMHGQKLSKSNITGCSTWRGLYGFILLWSVLLKRMNVLHSHHISPLLVLNLCCSLTETFYVACAAHVSEHLPLFLAACFILVLV